MVGKYFGADYSKSTAIAFTATKQFRIGHRSCRRIWHQQRTSFCWCYRPLVEVPALIALVNVAFWFRKILSNYGIKIILKNKTTLYLKIRGWFIKFPLSAVSLYLPKTPAIKDAASTGARQTASETNSFQDHKS
jgi:hypothetical protein